MKKKHKSCSRCVMDTSAKEIDFDEQGVWADSNRYNGWWFSVAENITYQGKDYIGTSAIVIDANENGVYDKNDYKCSNHCSNETISLELSKDI